MALHRTAILAGILACSVACNPLGPSCVSQSGPVASTGGVVGAGEVVVHRLPYGTEGSQNDIQVTWANQGQPGGPRLQFYATRTGCENFSPATATGVCQVLARAGSVDGVVVSTMIVTHGRGNPETLGTPPEYKVWVVGDSQQAASYSLSAVWRYGVEC
jgi:hypothetical protein